MIITTEQWLAIRVYETQSDMEDNRNAIETITEGIVDSSARLEHKFFTALPARGECNAAMFSCELGVDVDLTGKYINVFRYSNVDGESVTRSNCVFSGKIDSCKYDKYKTTRTLIAYDRMYELSNVDVSQWWNNYWSTQTGSVAASTVLQAMCEEFGVSFYASDIPSFALYAAGMKSRPLAATSFTQILTWVGEVYGAYWLIAGFGYLNFVSLRNANTVAATDAADEYVDTANSDFSDAVTTAYQQTIIYDGASVIYSNGSGQSFTITDNPLLAGRNASQYAATGDFAHVATVAMQGFTAATIETIVAQVTDILAALSSTNHSPIILTTADSGVTRRHLVSGITLYGSGLVNETFECTGETRTGAAYTASQNKVLSDLTNLGTQITFKVNADAVIEAVNLEAQGGVQINAEALNINGVQSTGGKLKVGVNGDVEVDGKITSSNGNIGGWTIGSGMISKTVTVSGYEYRVLLYAPETPNTGITAIGIQKRAVGETTWSQVSRFTYGGTLESKDATFNGRIVINPDMGSLLPSEHVFEIHDNDNGLHMMIDPSYILFTEGASLDADTSLHIGATQITQYTDDPSQGYPRTAAEFTREIYAWSQSQNEYFKEIYMASASSETVWQQKRTPRYIELRRVVNGTTQSLARVGSDEIVVDGHLIHNNDCVSYTIEADGDLNEYRREGRYFAFQNLSNLLNCPVNTSFVLEVLTPKDFGDSARFVYQRLTEYSTPNVYIRSYRVSTQAWTDWRRISTASDRATSTTFTPTSGTSVSAQGGCYYEVLNGQVHLHLALSGLTANTNTNVFTLPVAVRPSASMITGVGFGSGIGDNVTSRVVVTTAGVITVNSTGTAARIDLSYFL